MRLRFLLVALIVVIGAMGTGLYAQPWNYDFGTGNASHTSQGTSSTTLFPSPPAGGGTYTAWCGANSGVNGTSGLFLQNPGIPDFGSGSELRIAASTNTGNGNINKYAVTNYTATKVGYTRHYIRLGDPNGLQNTGTSGTFYFFWGDGASFENNNYASTASNQGEVFAGLKWTLASGSIVASSWVAGGTWTDLPTQPFQQGQEYTMEFFFDNDTQGTTNYTYNGQSITITKYYWHLWVNGQRIGTEYFKGGINQNKTLDSYMFYGEGSPNNAANLFIDGFYYNNSMVYNYTDYYSKPRGALDVLSTWGVGMDGTGQSPANFTTAGITYHIRNNPSPTLGDTNWDISGTGSKAILGDDANACTFTIPSNRTMSGTIDVSNAGNLILMGANPNLTLGTLAPGSTVSYSGTVNQDVKGAAYSNLQILGSGTKTLAGATSAANPTTVGDGSLVTLLIPAAYAFTGTINVSNNGTLEIANSTLPAIGTLATGSTVRYAYSGNQNVTGTTYYNLDVANGAVKTMLNDVSVTNLTFNTGTLALATKRLTLNGKYVSFHSTDAIFTSLSVNYTDAQVAGQGVGRIWDTNGSFTNSVDVTFTFPSATAPTSLYVWYKGDSGVWTKGSAVTHSYLEGIVTITVPGITSLSGGAKGPKSWTFAEGDQTLPVELSSFTAVISSTNYVQLTWITQSETNVAGFRIYRNTTDDLATAEMLNTFIQATNTSQTQVYVYTDEEIQGDGTYYYWLQNLDLDGSFSFHGPTMVTITGHEPGIPPVPVVLGINNAWPNPFNPTLTIKYGITKNGNAALDIYNQRGQLVRNLMSGARESGSYSQVWDGRDNSGRELPSGVYFIRLQASGKTFGHKVVLLK